MFLIKNGFIPGNIFGAHVRQFKIAYFCKTHLPSQKNIVSCVVKLKICGGEIKRYNLQECGD